MLLVLLVALCFPDARAVLDFNAADYDPSGKNAVIDVAALLTKKATPKAKGVPLHFEGRGDGLLYAEGLRFHVKGVNWYGSEDRTGAPTGLHKHSVCARHDGSNSPVYAVVLERSGL